MIIDEQFHMLRVALEKRGVNRLVVGVVTAKQEDGGAFVASSLGVAFAQAGYATLVLDAVPDRDGDRHMPASGVSPVSTISDTPNLHTASFASDRNGRRLDVPQLLQAVSDGFAVTIVNASNVPKSSIALEAANLADELIVAIRLGRRAGREDRALLSLLGERSSKILGVIPTRSHASISLERGEAAPAQIRDGRSRLSTAVGLVR